MPTEDSRMVAFLNGLGYSFVRIGFNKYKSHAFYRGGDNPNSLHLNLDKYAFYDFVAGFGGSIKKLISLTINKDLDVVDEILNNQGLLYVNASNSFFYLEQPKIVVNRVYQENFLTRLSQDHEYWINRGISRETMSEFEGGVPINNKSLMRNRYVFPIRCKYGKIIGFSGRYLKQSDLDKYKIPKWKNVGNKKSWVFPYLQSKDYIKKEKEIFIVESIGDMLSLWEAGIKNVIVSFGLHVQPKTLSFLLRQVPNKINICFNNDNNKETNTGFEYSKIYYKKLRKFFDKEQIEVIQPTKKDFGEMSKSEIINWKKSLE